MLETSSGTKMSTPVCLRCGSFLQADGSLVPGLPLCKECFPGVSKRQRYALPPWPIAARKTWPAALVGLAGVVLAGWGAAPRLIAMMQTAPLGADVVAKLLVIALGALVGGLVFFAVGLLVFASTLQHGGNALYKAHVLSTLGFPEDAGAAFKLVAYGPYWGRVGFPEVGLLLEGAGGLVFLGRRGTELAVPLSAIRAAGTGRGEPSWPLLQLRVDLATGERVWFRFLEGSSFFANGRTAREAARRLYPGKVS